MIGSLKNINKVQLFNAAPFIQKHKCVPLTLLNTQKQQFQTTLPLERRDRVRRPRSRRFVLKFPTYIRGFSTRNPKPTIRTLGKDLPTLFHTPQTADKENYPERVFETTQVISTLESYHRRVDEAVENGQEIDFTQNAFVRHVIEQYEETGKPRPDMTYEKAIEHFDLDDIAQILLTSDDSTMMEIATNMRHYLAPHIHKFDSLDLIEVSMNEPAEILENEKADHIKFNEDEDDSGEETDGRLDIFNPSSESDDSENKDQKHRESEESTFEVELMDDRFRQDLAPYRAAVAQIDQQIDDVKRREKALKEVQNQIKDYTKQFLDDTKHSSSGDEDGGLEESVDETEGTNANESVNETTDEQFDELKASLDGIPEEVRKEILEFMNTDADGPQDIETEKARQTIDEMLELSYYEQTSGLIGARNAYAAEKLRYVNTAAGDKMWELHKENPYYWTGERLGRAFGVSRGRAWGEVLLREYIEAEETGKTYNFKKGPVIFQKELQNTWYGNRFSPRRKDLIRGGMNDYASEEEMYEQFVENSIKETGPSGLDDDIPLWARLPFHEPAEEIEHKEEKEETEEPQATIKKVPLIENKSNLGTYASRSAYVIMEMNRRSEPEYGNRALLVKEKDETLRTMSEQEQEWMFRKRTVKRTKYGLGGRKKRLNIIRRRDFRNYNQ